MQVEVKWAGDALFEAHSESGHTVSMDGPPEQGGKNLAPRPMEMMLMGMGGCTSFDVMMILRKSRQDVSDCVAQISAQRADEVPSVFTAIHVHFVVTGTALKPALVKRAVSLSAEKYCSASIMLERAGVRITHDFEIREAA